MHGLSHERTTGTQSLETAKRIARQIIRGEEPVVRRRDATGMTVTEFEAIQKKHFSLAERSVAGEKSLGSFLGVWRSFLKACPIKTIHEVTESVALEYLHTLQKSDRNQNHNYKKSRCAKPLSRATIRKHIRTLSGAWNRVRDGHEELKAGIAPSKRVSDNPWERIRTSVPKQKREADPIQFKISDGDLSRFLATFRARPVAELFMIISLWSAGRLGEMTSMEWSWFSDAYIMIPDVAAKRGKGKVVRIPTAIRERLERFKVKGSPYVFAMFANEVERSLKSCHEVMPFSPERMQWRIQKLIAASAKAIGRPEITHHALRRTSMELSNEGELRDKRKMAAAKLQTTVGNMTRNYLAKVGRKERLLSDGLYENLTVALRDYPELAKQLGCEPVEFTVEQEVDALIKTLTPVQLKRLQKRLREDGDEEEGQGVA
jgi:integrase